MADYPVLTIPKDTPHVDEVDRESTDRVNPGPLVEKLQKINDPCEPALDDVPYFGF